MWERLKKCSVQGMPMFQYYMQVNYTLQLPMSLLRQKHVFTRLYSSQHFPARLRQTFPFYFQTLLCCLNLYCYVSFFHEDVKKINMMVTKISIYSKQCLQIKTETRVFFELKTSKWLHENCSLTLLQNNMSEKHTQLKSCTKRFHRSGVVTD